MDKSTMVWVTLLSMSVIHTALMYVTGDSDYWVSSQSFLAASFIAILK